MPDSNPPEPDSQDAGEEFEHLPGLEPDDPAPAPAPAERPDPTPQTEATPPAAATAPERYGDGQWTNEELRVWYENEYGGDDQFNAQFPARSWDGRPVPGLPQEIADARAELDPENTYHEETIFFGDTRFAELHPDLKAKFRDHIEARDAAAEPPAEARKAGWAPSSYQVDVTMPDGSVGTVNVEVDVNAAPVDPSSSIRWLRDHEGNVTELSNEDYEPANVAPPADPGTKVSSTGSGGFPRNLVLGAGGLIVVALAVVFLVSSGGGASGPWSATDPLNDFAPTWSDKEPIENPSSAGDVTHLLVEIDGNDSTVTVTFAGDAEQLLIEGGEELSAALQFLPVGDERFIDMLLSEDGTSKISDPPSGSSISHSWTSSNVLVFQITGLTPASGATVRFATIQRLGFGHSTDEVSVSTGATGSAPATAEPIVVDSSGGVPDAPLIIQPCSVIDMEIAELFGSVVLADQGGNDRKLDCRYVAEAAGITLDMLVQRNSAPRSGVFKSFRSVNEDAIEVRTLPWSEESELRVSEFGSDRSKASVLAYVITSDPLGRDVYLWITVVGPPGDGEALGEFIETFAELLRDAILEAQP